MDGEYGWLPDPIVFSGKPEDLENYIDTLYYYFKKEFYETKPEIGGKPVIPRKLPYWDTKAGLFGYLIHNHLGEPGERDKWELSLKRCKRIQWIKALIEAYETGSRDVVYWYKRHGKQKRLKIALKDWSYFVVLVERGSRFILWTAFYREEQWRVEKLIAEHEKYWESKRRP